MTRGNATIAIVATLIMGPASGTATASEGLYAALTYMCNAEKMNARIVEACSASHPQLAAAASAASAKWHARIGAKADAAARECAKAFEGGSPQGKAEFEAMSAHLLESIEKGAKDADGAYCTSAIHELSEGSDFEDSMWRDVK